MSNIDKRALRQLATRATPGPWEEENGEVWIMRNGTATSILTGVCGDDTSGQQDFDNARFISAANPATVLALLDELVVISKSEWRLAGDLTEAQMNNTVLEKKLEAAEKRIAELSHHLKCAHGFIEHTEAFGHEAASGILCCGDAQWNVDASKSVLAAVGKGE